MADWTTNGAGRFLGWLDSQPWRGGGICALHCRDDLPNTALVEAIAKSAHAVNRGSTGLRVEWLDQEPGAGVTPIERIKALLSVDESIAHFEGIRAIRRELSAFSFLFVFSTHVNFAPAWWWELRSLADLLAKDEPAVGLCAVVLDPMRLIDSVSVFDFMSTYPQLDVLCDQEETDASRWRRYLHQRIAWEAGGNIAVAYSIDEYVRGIRVGDDADLESRLGAAATDLLRVKGAEAVIVGYLAYMDRALTKGSSQIDPESAAAELFATGGLWRPPLSGVLDVVPWVCRAVLRSGTAPQSLARLRSNLVCAPLRGEIFQLCLRAESIVRQALLSKKKRHAVPESSAQALDRLVRGEDGYLHYPSGHPSPPTRTGDEWTFATFGEFLHAHQSADVLDNYRKLLGLRNAVAHGHYLTWKHVQMAVDIRSALSI